MTTSRFCPYCGAAHTPNAVLCHACQQPLDTLPDAQMLNGRYAILSEVGVGGFGAVYQARDMQEQDRLVAVKQINLKGLSPQEIIEATDSFNREAEILSTLNHPMLPRIFDRFSDPEHWYLVMSFIDGTTLDEYIQQHTASTLTGRTDLSLDETLRIGIQLCTVLEYLHTRQPSVIFRDIKPGNIMCTASGRLYLIDFGIARHFKPGQAKDTIPFGSPGFAAPEQYGRAQTTPQADIYSLGALLYCLVSGDDPADHPFQFAPLRLYGIDGISELNNLIQRMVALTPEQRPADILEVRDELLAIQYIHAQANKQHIWTPPPGQTPPAGNGQQQQFLFPSPALQQRKTTRRRVVTAGLAVGTVALVGCFVAWTSQQLPVPATSSSSDQGLIDPTQQAITEQNATATTSNQTPAVPLNGPTYWSPDLSQAAVANLQENQIEVYKAGNQQNLFNIKLPASFSNPTIQWSPDQSKILAQADTGMIQAWSIKNGKSLFVFDDALIANTGAYSQATTSWSPNGEYCAISYTNLSTSNDAYFVILRGSDGKQLTQKSFPNYNSYAIPILAWSPDSRYLAFPNASEWSNGERWAAEIWDNTTSQIVGSFGNILSAGSGTTMISSILWSPDGRRIAINLQGTLWLGAFDNNHLGNIPAYLPYSGYTSYSDSHGMQAWSPDEKYMAALLNESLAIWDVVNGDAAYLNSSNSPSNLAAFAWSADSKSITTANNGNIITQWAVG